MMRAHSLPIESEEREDTCARSRLMSWTYGYPWFLTANYILFCFSQFLAYAHGGADLQRVLMDGESLFAFGICVLLSWYVTRGHKRETDCGNVTQSLMKQALQRQEGEIAALEAALQEMQHLCLLAAHGKIDGRLSKTGPLAPLAQNFNALLDHVQSLEETNQHGEEQHRQVCHILQSWDYGWLVTLPSEASQDALLAQAARSQRFLSTHFRQLRQAVESWDGAWKRSQHILEESRLHLRSLIASSEQEASVSGGTVALLIGTVDGVLGQLSDSLNSCQPGLQRTWNLSNIFRQQVPLGTEDELRAGIELGNPGQS